jgi:hypothetical protein
MGNDKDEADRNAHERMPADRSQTNPIPNDRVTPKTEKDEENPLRRLRFGSAGSGGAEREPGPERP